jgi:PIN domain nuclease of toxin-antitoxin system
VRALVDTHVAIWYVQGDPRLPRHVAEWLEQSDHHRLFSAASAWEIVIKASIGKMPLKRPALEFIDACIADLAMERLPILYDHVYRVASLPRHHGDPFDRMLVAQALVEDVAVVTGDAWIGSYGVQVIW